MLGPIAACHDGASRATDAGPGVETESLAAETPDLSELPGAPDGGVDADFPATPAGVDAPPATLAADAADEAGACTSAGNQAEPGTLLWVRSTPASLAEVVSGSCGDVFVQGSNQQAGELAGQPLPLAPFLVHVDRNGTANWVRGWTTTNTGILAMAALPQGRLLAVGEFEGPADFGGPSLVTGNGLDAFVARYDARGDLLSFARYGDGKSQWADSVATNAAGEAVLAANGYGTADFGTGALSPPWLVSLDSEGRVRWARNFPAPLGGSLLSLDDQGTATITSIMNGPINLGDGSIGVTSSGGPQYPQFFLASFDARGTLRWSKGYIGGGVSGLAALSNGDIAVTAARWSTGVGTAPPPFDLGCGPIDTTVYVARLGSDGSCRWARTLSGAQQPLLAVTGGDLVVAGRAYAAPQDPELGLLPGSGSLFVERISATGTALWGRVFGQVSAGNVVGLYRLAASSSGIWLTGSFTDTLDLGSGTMAATSPNSAGFLARLAP